MFTKRASKIEKNAKNVWSFFFCKIVWHEFNFIAFGKLYCGMFALANTKIKEKEML